jgi:hypothetical protein
MVAKWIKLDWAQRLVLLEAACYLTAAQIAVHLLPFRWLAPRLGRMGGTSGERSISPEQQRQAQQIGWAVTALARYFPWDTKCLAQAVAGKWMLQRRGLPTVLYLGIDRGSGEENWLVAHAWLLCGTDFVTGEPQHERFQVLTAFSEDGK